MLKEFSLDSVQVTDPYYVNAFNKVVDYLLRLEPDRLLAGFKAVSEGKDPGEEPNLNLYAGWEDAWSLLRGHTMGHYLTAMAQAYKQTKNSDANLNSQLKKQIDYTIDCLRAYQEASPNGYLFASPETHFDIIEGKATGKHWVPWYSMHKILAGAVDVYRYTGNEKALAIASTLGDWAYGRTSKWDDDLQRRVLNIEYGGINIALYDLYKITKDEKHLEAAKKFDEDDLFAEIEAGNDLLENRHANTQIPKFIGALNRYEVLGEEADFYFNAGKKFWEMVIKDHTYITGGNSESEHFRKPGRLDESRTNINNETCNAYNMLLLTRKLFKFTGDVKYADFYERTHLNEIMASVHPETGMTTYFKPMATGYFKAYGTETHSFWCCTGTGMENFTKLGDSIYFYSDDDLYINQYLSSKLNWEARGLALTVEADLPSDDQVLITIEAAPTQKQRIKFRIPSWLAANSKLAISINDQPVSATEKAGYLVIDRTWAAGDQIKLHLPTEVKVERLADNPNVVAFSYGPVVLSAALGKEKMEIEPHWASIKPMLPEGVEIKDYLVIQSGTIEDWLNNIQENLVRKPGTLEFNLRGTDGDQSLTFTPYYLEHEERYGIYFRLVSPESITLESEGKPAEQKNEIDAVQITNDQSELVHNLQGNTVVGTYEGYNFRQMTGGEGDENWFSYDLAVDPRRTNFAAITYYSGDAGSKINIYVDDQLLSEETVVQKDTKFYTVEYQLPDTLLVDKQKVTLKFVNSKSELKGRIFDRVVILAGN